MIKRIKYLCIMICSMFVALIAVTFCGRGTSNPGTSNPGTSSPDTSTTQNKPLPDWLQNYQKQIFAHTFFPIAAYPEVSDTALNDAKYIIEHMITPQQATDLFNMGTALVITGVNQKVSQLPGLNIYLSGGPSWAPNGSWDDLTDGAGPSQGGMPVSVIFERHLLHLPTDLYHDENILVHEFGHHVMNIWLANKRADLYTKLIQAYQTALTNGVYQTGSYAISNSEEYWAEGTQVYFNATYRTDASSTGGITHDDQKNKDPELYSILSAVYGSTWDCRNSNQVQCTAHEAPPKD